jgi:hypothetical protein
MWAISGMDEEDGGSWSGFSSIWGGLFYPFESFVE